MCWKVWPRGELRSAAKSVGLLYAWLAAQFDALQTTVWPSDDVTCVSMLTAANRHTFIEMISIRTPKKRE